MLDTAKASRLGTFALMRPVTTSTLGRWVASTRWMPEARASCVMRTIESSTSRGATIMRSASSSTTTSRYGYGVSTRSLPAGSTISFASTARLKSSMWRKPNDARSSYRMSISLTTHWSASAAFFGFVMMGVMRCGTPWYAASSTRFGSTSTIRTSSGFARMSTEQIIELMKLDLPEPVDPATSRWGIFARFATRKPPSTSLPSPIVIGCALFEATPERSTSPSETISRSRFGISMPIALLPGIGERIATSLLATAYDEVLGERRDAFDLDAVAERDLVAGDAGAAREAGDLGVDLELGEHAGDRRDHLVVGGRAGLGRGAGSEQGCRGQSVGPARRGAAGSRSPLELPRTTALARRIREAREQPGGVLADRRRSGVDLAGEALDRILGPHEFLEQVDAEVAVVVQGGLDHVGRVVLPSDDGAVERVRLVLLAPTPPRHRRGIVARAVAPSPRSERVPNAPVSPTASLAALGAFSCGSGSSAPKR